MSPAAPPPSATAAGAPQLLPQRQCGRCRKFFDGDPTLDPIVEPDWWCCPPCRVTLLGDDRQIPEGPDHAH